MEAINAALRKIKYRGEQKLTQYLLTEEDMTRISTVNRFLTKLDIFSTTLGGDQYVTSSVLLPVNHRVIAAQAQAQAQASRQSVCSAGWVSCWTRGGSAWWWERHHAALPEQQPGALSRCLFDSKMRWQYIMVPTRIASKLICFPGDIFVLIGFVIIGG